MDKHRVTLANFRSRALDGDDPVFAEALRAVGTDPELAAWFEEEQKFDQHLREKLSRHPVPANLKADILQASGPSPRQNVFAWPKLAAAAAILLAILVAWQLWWPKAEADSLALRAINFSETMPPLQMVCFDANAVAAWVNEQPGLKSANFVQLHGTLSMHLMGASAIEWDGKPVAMLCLQNDRKMALLYLFRGSDFQCANEEPRVMKRGSWVTRTGHAGPNKYVLATRGPEEDLEFELPF